MMQIISVSNLSWADDAHTAVNMTVEFDGLGRVPFTASMNDVEAHGVALFNDAVAGKYGAISAPPAKSLSDAKAEKLAALDKERARIENLPISGDNNGTPFKLSRPEKINEFLMGGVQLALDPSSNAKFTMLDDDGVSVEYSKALMSQIIQFIVNYKAPMLGRYAGKKAAIEAAASTAEVDAVDVDLTKS